MSRNRSNPLSRKPYEYTERLDYSRREGAVKASRIPRVVIPMQSRSGSSKAGSARTAIRDIATYGGQPVTHSADSRMFKRNLIAVRYLRSKQGSVRNLIDASNVLRSTGIVKVIKRSGERT